MRVAVVSDGALRLAIDRLRGEWKLATDGVVETLDFPAGADTATAKEAGQDFDLIVFPSRSLGALCEAQLLRPVRPSVLKSEELRFEDFLPLIRDHEIVYAQRVMALPLGCPTPLLLASDESEVSCTAPVDDLELALAYLAWAAPHAEHRSRVATLFDFDTFEPRLARPPFVRALEEFIDAMDGGPGRIVWPARDEPLPEGLTPRGFPGAEASYDPLADEWDASAPGGRAATLLASSGRLIAVTKASRNAATAFRFAAWLAGPENASQLSMASDAVANCRGSRSRSVDGWRATEDRPLARSFTEAVAEALRAPRYLLAPRLPGSEEYLRALAKHVRDALDGAPPQEALAAAAADWEAISAARGRDAQRAAYERSLNSARFPAGE
ncbi:hypothetical protein MalM25_12320 [Planctomycetes bacterium MalM25]|nr:hypothetical protein MalM25_12320 [Planctomycetes bacterium MalM25]